ncbi:hypothetical protein PCS76_19635 [Acinetobacter baumannii]|nr:hypothetical protein [Acinetobacter baumannii]
MRLNVDEREWGEVTLQYQKADPVVGSRVIGLAETWMEDLETALADDVDLADAKEATASALRIRHADLSIYEFLEALILVSLYWEQGEDLVDALTELERFMYVTALAPKLLANAESAAEFDPED